MRKDRPSMTARKAALSIVTLGAKAGMDKTLPSGIVQATESKNRYRCRGAGDVPASRSGSGAVSSMC